MPSWVNLQAYAFDKPIQYKKLLLYPVLMENYFEFHICIESLLIEKNRTVEGISKTYLEYLYFLENKGDENVYLLKFDNLLKLCLRNKELNIVYPLEKGKFIFKIEEEKYNSDDFDELRLLMCEQNLIELPDETKSAEVRDSIAEAKRFKARLNGLVPPTLEDMIACVVVSTNMKPEDIEKLSIRKFEQILQRADIKLHYQIFLTATMSGFVKFEDKSVLNHWMCGIEETKWEDTMIDIDVMRGKLAFDDKKLK